MRDFPQHRWPRHFLRRAKVENDAGNFRRVARAPIVNAALAISPGCVSLEHRLAVAELNARGLVHPGQHAPQQRPDVFLAHRATGQNRKIQVLGEPVGFQVALLQACAALEDPVQSQRFVGANAPQQPA